MEVRRSRENLRVNEVSIYECVGLAVNAWVEIGILRKCAL
jgi:hypothetical protein